MRIAEVVNSLEIGGAERMVVDLARCLQAWGHSLHVICLRGSGKLAEPLMEAGIYALALEKGDGFSVTTLARLTSYIRKEGIDVVHTHNPLVHHYGAAGGRLAGAPVVVNTLHGMSNINGADRASRIFKAASGITDCIVSVCQTAHTFFEERTGIPRSKLEVIYNGIPLEKFLPSHCDKPREGFVFGAVGRLVPVKDHHSLLKAFQLVKHRRPDCRLEILGDGPLRRELEELARSLGVADAVQFHGSHLDVSSFLHRVDTFVLSSVSEGLPLTMLEAMAAGLPVVATSVGGVPELIGATGCGWLCPPGHPEALAESMITAAQSSQRNEMGREGQSFVIQRYSLDKMAREYEKLFERLLSQKLKVKRPLPERHDSAVS
jgi:glycosyltransferase involved in cell wall biosynthesis